MSEQSGIKSVVVFVPMPVRDSTGDDLAALSEKYMEASIALESASKSRAAGDVAWAQNLLPTAKIALSESAILAAIKQSLTDMVRMILTDANAEKIISDELGQMARLAVKREVAKYEGGHLAMLVRKMIDDRVGGSISNEYEVRVDVAISKKEVRA